MKISIQHDANDSSARLRSSSSIRVVWRESQHWAPAFRIPPGFAIFLSLAAETLFRPNMIQEEGIINLLANGSKVEQLHALARDVFYARRGRINARELWEQMNTCSCLTLILACIVYWQAREISRLVSQCDPDGNGIDLSLLEHVSPIEWDNVVLYGQYILDRKLVRRRCRIMRASA